MKNQKKLQSQFQSQSQSQSRYPSPADIAGFRKYFPQFDRENPPVYFDNAATTLKPRCVINAVTEYFTGYCANIHRGLYESSLKATRKYEMVREIMAEFIDAAPDEIVFTPNTTYAINMAAASLPGLISDGSRKKILLPFSEHHSNILPWMNLKKYGFYVEFIDVNTAGRIDLEDYTDRLDRTTAIVAASMVSNVCGAVNPISGMIEAAHLAGALFLTDAAQAAAHLPLSVKKLDTDFLALSGHKMYAPPGSGILYGKRDLLKKILPVVVGGGTVSSVSRTGYELLDIPMRLEPGTPDIPAIIGMGEAAGFIKQIDFDYKAYEKELLVYAVNKLSEIKGLCIPGFDQEGEDYFKDRTGIIPFIFSGWDCEDLPILLDKDAHIAIRSGFHCAKPFTETLNPHGVHRISFAPYNTFEEADLLIAALTGIADELL
jgi:cysteine desulfurase/selenocysteine lyase